MQVYEALQEMRSSGKWDVASIRQLAPEFEAKLASGQPHNLPALAVPMAVPGVPEGLPPMEVLACLLGCAHKPSETKQESVGHNYQLVQHKRRKCGDNLVYLM